MRAGIECKISLAKKLPITLGSSSPFITEWTVSGDATARTITLPLVSGYSYNCVVDWGDGTTPSLVTAYNDANRIHTYASDGTYVVKVYGVCEGFSFNNSGDKIKITKVIHWGDTSVFEGFKYLKGGFYGCSNLTSIGSAPIPASGSGLGSDGFESTFQDCAALTTVFSDIFSAHTLVESFYRTFRGCTSITSIPSGLFANNTAVTNMAQIFMFCTSLASVPSGVFDNNTAVTDFNAVFYGCTVLASTPSELFRFNTVCTDFASAFYDCDKHQQNIDLFYRAGEESIRFLNQNVDFTSCFRRVSFTGTQGTAPDLWNCNFGTGTPTTTSCWAGAGNSVTSLSNYASIPAGWK